MKRAAPLPALVALIALTACPGDIAPTIFTLNDTADTSAPAAADTPAPGPDVPATEPDVPVEPDVPAELDVGPDVPEAPQCPPPPAEPTGPTGPSTWAPSAGGGVDQWELEAWAKLRDAALEDPGVHFAATWDHTEDAYVVTAGPASDRHEVRFRRHWLPEGGLELEVLSGDLDAIFPHTSATRWPSYDELLGALVNPDGVDLTSLDYTADDPRVGWLSLDDQSFPEPLARLAALFDGDHAPDGVVDRWPWAHGSGGSHGGMSLLQTRATLILSGRGARSGVVLNNVARLVDVAPTAMAALAAPTTGGLGPDGVYDDGLYLLRQDGRVLTEALDPDPCVRPAHVLILLFDGWMANELNHLLLDPDPEVDLPALRGLAEAGATYRYGALAGFPTMSAPGHMTVGTGQWNGHHDVTSNRVYDRATRQLIDPLATFSDPTVLAADPEGVLEIYDLAVRDGTETLPQALHRALGPWDPEAGTGAFVAVFNEPSFVGADASTFTTLTGVTTALDLSFYELADDLAALQIEDLLDDTTVPVPTLTYASMVSTDGAGEAAGPHSELLRQTALDIDDRVADILAAYEERGALDDTLVILTADHGMELQDPTRAHTLGSAVVGSGVAVLETTTGMFHLKTLELAVDGQHVVVTDHDDGSPVPGATVTCGACPDPIESGPDGSAPLPVTAAEAGTIEATHPDYNPQSIQP